MPKLSVRNLTRTKFSPALFEKARKAVLPSWDISLAFVAPTEAQQLNVDFRNKPYTPNVLSYEAGKNSGEVIICPSVAKQQAPSFGLDPKPYTLYLFIHGLFHLKGMSHGTTMEKSERALLEKLVDAPLHKNNETLSHHHRH